MPRDMEQKPAEARARAARAIVQVLAHNRYLDAALEEAAAGVPDETRALVQELAYGTLRFFHELAGIAALFLARPFKPKDQDVYALLLLGLYQLRHMRIAAHAAVDETVEAAAVLGKPWSRSLMNACLRESVRQKGRVEAVVAADPAMRHSHPAWLIDETRRAYPQDWEAILAANNQRPPMWLRVNLARIARADYLARLHAAGLSAQPHPIVESAVVLARPLPVTQLPGFAEGLVSVQDAAAQLAAVFLAAAPGERVLDACAAPGGKTAHILERASGPVELVAVDREAERLALIANNLERLGLAVPRLVAGDAAAPAAWWDGQPFDRILADVPCSATGVIRRHPDIKLRRRPEDLPRLMTTQARILAGLWPLLRRGGKLLYVTCSILPGENEAQIGAFLDKETGVVEIPLPPAAGTPRAHGRQRLPGEQGMDGFYYACLEKR